MTIHKAKATNYSTVKTEYVVGYIMEYLDNIEKTIADSNKSLLDCNKAQLNQIAAELETVKKRLDYILEGRY